MNEYEKIQFQKFYSFFVEWHPLYPRHQKVYDEKCSSILSKDISLTEALTEFTVFARDGHTNIELPYGERSLCINACCRWEEKGLRVVEVKGIFLKPGDVIVAVGKESIESYFRFLETRIPHENVYLVKSRSVNYPYENYHALSFRNYSSFRNTSESAMELSVLRDGKVLDIQEPFVEYDGTLCFCEEKYSNRFYFTEDNIGVLELISCSYDEETGKLLYDFFCLVKEKKTEKIILDLSGNMGGNSNIIDEFLKYLHVDKYRHYQIYERDGMELKCIQSRDDYQLCEGYKWSDFGGELLCNIGNDTFSSARMFATILRDNGIALLTGSPSGGKPSSCGQPNRFSLWTEDGMQIKCRISTRLFLRPDEKSEEQETLLPDTSVAAFTGTFKGSTTGT